MPAEPQISVLIPCWNAAASIRDTLRSVLDQTAVPLECIVVDDASTDATVAEIEATAAGDPRLVLVRLSENRGVSNARNVGLERVRGDWLTLLDADDRLVPGSLERLVTAGTQRDALAVVGQQVWTDGTRTWLSAFYDQPDIRRPGRTSIAARPGLLYYASPHGKLLHRSCWEGLTFEGRVLGDQPWTIRALLRAGDRIEVLEETVYLWQRPAPGVRGASITVTSRASARRSVDAVRVAERAFSEVAAETARTIADPADRQRITDTYAQRLIRSDLGVYLKGALDRDDPTIGELLSAIDGFVAGLPTGTLEVDPAPTHSLLEPPAIAWRRLEPTGRGAYRALLTTALARWPDALRHTRDPFVRVAILAIARGGIRPVDRLILWVAYVGHGLVDLARRVLRRTRRTVGSAVARVRSEPDRPGAAGPSGDRP